MLLLVLVFANATPPMKLEWFSDEKSAGRSLDAYLKCTGSGILDRQADTRQSDEVAEDILATCDPEVGNLQLALADVFRRKRDFILAGKSPNETAASYIHAANAQVEPMVREGRKNTNAPNN